MEFRFRPDLFERGRVSIRSGSISIWIRCWQQRVYSPVTTSLFAALLNGLAPPFRSSRRRALERTVTKAPMIKDERLSHDQQIEPE